MFQTGDRRRAKRQRRPSQSPISRGYVSDGLGEHVTACKPESQSPISRGYVSDSAASSPAPSTLSSLNPLYLGAMFQTGYAPGRRSVVTRLNPLYLGAMFQTVKLHKQNPSIGVSIPYISGLCFRRSRAAAAKSSSRGLNPLYLGAMFQTRKTTKYRAAALSSQSPISRGYVSDIAQKREKLAQKRVSIPYISGLCFRRTFKLFFKKQWVTTGVPNFSARAQAEG